MYDIARLLLPSVNFFAFKYAHGPFLLIQEVVRCRFRQLACIKQYVLDAANTQASIDAVLHLDIHRLDSLNAAAGVTYASKLVILMHIFHVIIQAVEGADSGFASLFGYSLFSLV